MKIATNKSNSIPAFKVIIDNKPKEIIREYSDTDKKYLLSIINTFESGSWREKEFFNFIFDNLEETALSKEEREACIGIHTKLQKACEKLKSKDEKNRGGEIAEIMLYGILKNYYEALPVVPKIFYKQNTEDYAKGADSVHVVIENKKVFSYWLGEAKFYNSIDPNRFDNPISSVKELLNDEKLRKENSFVTNLKDLKLVLNDDGLYKKVRAQLDDGVSLDEIKKILHIPIFILHECEETQKSTEYSNDYEKTLKQQYVKAAESFFNKQDKKLSEVFFYNEITFHLIFFPVPKKETIVKNFYKKVKEYKE